MNETKIDNRKKLINWLIENDMDYLDHIGGREWLRFVLRNGFEGYDKQTYDQLLSEVLERDPDFCIEGA